MNHGDAKGVRGSQLIRWVSTRIGIHRRSKCTWLNRKLGDVQNSARHYGNTHGPFIRVGRSNRLNLQQPSNFKPAIFRRVARASIRCAHSDQHKRGASLVGDRTPTLVARQQTSAPSAQRANGFVGICNDSNRSVRSKMAQFTAAQIAVSFVSCARVKGNHTLEKALADTEKAMATGTVCFRLDRSITKATKRRDRYRMHGEETCITRHERSFRSYAATHFEVSPRKSATVRCMAASNHESPTAVGGNRSLARIARVRNCNELSSLGSRSDRRCKRMANCTRTYFEKRSTRNSKLALAQHGQVAPSVQQVRIKEGSAHIS